MLDRYRPARIATLAVLAMALLASGCSSSSKGDRAPTASGAGASGVVAGQGAVDPGCKGQHLTVGLGAPSPDPTQSMYTTIPLAMGYWKDQGLDVQIIKLNGAAEMFQYLQAGRLDVSIGVSGSTLVRAANKDVKVKEFYNTVSGNVYRPYVVKGGSITTVAQLLDSRIGVQNIANDSITFLQAMAVKLGKAPSSLKLVVTGSGADASQFLIKHDIDAYGLFDGASERISSLLAEKGVTIEQLDLGEFNDVGFLGGMYALDKTISGKAAALKCFARGVAMGTAFAAENPENAAKVHFKEYPDTAPAGLSLDAAIKGALVALNARLKSMPVIDNKYGYVSEQAFQDMINLVASVDKPAQVLAPADIWTDQFLAYANDFDVATVKAAADDYKG